MNETKAWVGKATLGNIVAIGFCDGNLVSGGDLEFLWHGPNFVPQGYSPPSLPSILVINYMYRLSRGSGEIAGEVSSSRGSVTNGCENLPTPAHFA